MKPTIAIVLFALLAAFPAAAQDKPLMSSEPFDNIIQYKPPVTDETPAQEPPAVVPEIAPLPQPPAFMAEPSTMSAQEREELPPLIMKDGILTPDPEAIMKKRSTDPQWKRDMQAIADGKYSCMREWGVSWMWAKLGHVEARWHILRSMYYGSMAIPQFSVDALSVNRDYMALAVHTLGMPRDTPMYNDIIVKPLVEGFRAFPQLSDKFLQCLKDNPGASCTDIALDANLAPEFEAFARQVDTAISQGAAPACSRPEKETPVAQKPVMENPATETPKAAPKTAPKKSK